MALLSIAKENGPSLWIVMKSRVHQLPVSATIHAPGLLPIHYFATYYPLSLFKATEVISFTKVDKDQGQASDSVPLCNRVSHSPRSSDILVRKDEHCVWGEAWGAPSCTWVGPG